MQAQTSLRARARTSGRPATFSGARVQKPRALAIRCSAADSSRRDALIAGGAALVAPLIISRKAFAEEGTSKYNVKYLPVDKLGNFQKADQRNEYRIRAEQTIMKYLSPEDSPAAIRLALVDAGGYDEATKTGGLNGSVFLASGEVRADIKDVVEKLRSAKKEIDEGDKVGAGPISWADLVVLAGKATTQARWAQIKINRAELKSGGEFIATNFANPWPVLLGRIDSDVAGPNKVPSFDAPVEEIKDYLLKLGAKGDSGPFSAKPPFWEKPGYLLWTAAAPNPDAEEERFAAYSSQYANIKKGYDMSRRTVTRTDYEVDFVAVYNKLTSLGVKYRPDAYLYPQPILDFKI